VERLYFVSGDEWVSEWVSVEALKKPETALYIHTFDLALLTVSTADQFMIVLVVKIEIVGHPSACAIESQYTSTHDSTTVSSITVPVVAGKYGKQKGESTSVLKYSTFHMQGTQTKPIVHGMSPHDGGGFSSGKSKLFGKEVDDLIGS